SDSGGYTEPASPTRKQLRRGASREGLATALTRMDPGASAGLASIVPISAPLDLRAAQRPGRVRLHGPGKAGPGVPRCGQGRWHPRQQHLSRRFHFSKSANTKQYYSQCLSKWSQKTSFSRKLLHLSARMSPTNQRRISFDRTAGKNK
ncbi:MAG: hypothetical protein US15_C0063G0007, partial [Candidatus Moranbacteria bacterium GW2011_GWF1_36_4]